MIEFSSHVSGDTLFFYVNTHRFDTGAATDADSVPTYRIYIQENGTVVATGSMALLDSANTAGFYSEAVSLAAFDPGEYVCYISATVNSVTGTKSFPFTVGQGAGATLVRTTIATLASQTSFTLTGGPADNDAVNGCMIVVRDAVSVDQFCVGIVLDYTGASKTVTLAADPAVFTMAVGDFAEIVAAKVDPWLWRGTAIPAPNVVGVPKVDLVDIDGAATNGNNATLKLKRLDIQDLGGTGEAVFISTSGGVFDAVTIEGDGNGIRLSGGDTGIRSIGVGGYGAYFQGSGAGGEGIYSLGQGGAAGITVSSLGGGKSINAPEDIAVSDGDLTLAAIANETWDEVLTGATHNIASSSGRRLRQLQPNDTALRSGTAQAGGVDTITLDAGASAVDDFYNNTFVVLTGGTGSGQARLIVDYAGGTKIATVDSNWSVQPDVTTTFDIMPLGTVEVASIRVDAVTDIWTAASRTLTSFGTLVTDIWAAAVRTITGGTVTTNADKTGYTLTDADHGLVADKLLGRSLAGGSDAGDALNARSVRNALRILRNLRQIVAGVLTVFKEDDATTAWTAAVGTTPGDPVDSIDPT